MFLIIFHLHIIHKQKINFISVLKCIVYHTLNKFEFILQDRLIKNDKFDVIYCGIWSHRELLLATFFKNKFQC